MSFRKYFKNKQRGGAVNHRGNTYEQYFATFKIIESINNYPTTLSQVKISTQTNSFVDDLFILNGVVRHFFQLKTSIKLSWRKGFKSLQFDFLVQKRLELYNKRKFRLNLVTSQLQLKNTLTTSLPSGLKGCTNVVYFPYYESIPKQITNDTEFKKQLVALCAINSVDKLEALAQCVVGVWVSCDQKNIVLSDILSQVRNMGYSFIKTDVPSYLDQSTIDILNNINNFNYKINSGGYFEWEYKSTDKGIIPFPLHTDEFKNIEREINSLKSADFNQLEPIIS